MTANFIRQLCKNNVIRFIRTGNSSLARALEGKRIFKCTADAIAEKLNVPTDEIFDTVTTTEPYAYETTHKLKRTLRAVLAYAKKQRLITENYAKSEYIIVPQRPDHEIEYLDDEEAKRFYEALMKHKDIWNNTAMMIVLMTGFRLGELCGLEWRDIDYDKQKISIERSVTTVEGYGKIEKCPKIKKSKRTISVPSSLLEQIKEYKIWYDEYRESIGDRWMETEKLFTGQFGGTVNPGNVCKWLEKILKEAADLPHVTVHRLRHTT